MCLWFPDGNVVLATNSLLFKVHKSILSLQSSVFKDMFDLPTVDGSHPVQGTVGIVPEMYDGLPLVTLVGDKGEDVAHLLGAVYKRRCVLFFRACVLIPLNILGSYYRHDKNDASPRTVAALLVLSTKYDFSDIRADVVVQLSRFYPMTEGI